MQATNTTHPPAGATALLPSVDFAIWNIGWYYLPAVLLSCAIVLVIALISNNIQRQYPKYWISPPKPAPVPSPPSPPPSKDLKDISEIKEYHVTEKSSFPSRVDSVYPSPPASPQRRGRASSYIPRSDSRGDLGILALSPTYRSDSQDSHASMSSNISEHSGNSQVIIWAPGKLYLRHRLDGTID